MDFVKTKLVPAFEKLDGVTAYVLKGDRGGNKSKVGFFLVFEPVELSNRYFPEADEAWSEDVGESVQGIWEEFTSFFDDLGSEYTDWIIL